jgi:uncharacterized protein (TIGR02757 family)
MSLKKSYKGIPAQEIKEYLEEKYLQFNNPSFIDCDPISIPHGYTDNRDREIAGFLAAAIAWGRRDLILRSSRKMMDLMGNSPYDFIMNADADEMERFSGFVHRTLNSGDLIAFLQSLRHVYSIYSCMEDAVTEGMKNGGTLCDGLAGFRKIFFSQPHPHRAEKHFADIRSGAAGKRLFMFLRWMVRDDKHGVDFGIWKKIRPSELYIPLDLHSGNTARKLGLLERKQNDFRAVDELTSELRYFDHEDPVKYDFALFGLGVNEKIL